MRWFLLLLGLTLFTAFAEAQEQEDKLVDRIMRPNMELSNPAQNKKFLAVEGTSIDKKFHAKSFSTGEKTSSTFWGLKRFLSKSFGTGKYARAEAAADARASAELAYASTQFQTKKSALVRTSSASGQVSTVRAYAGSRPFLAHGTRQKQLSQERHTMTIDEVRELLNKNK